MQEAALIERFRSLKILVVGDIMLDRYLWGHVDRISPEAPVPVVDIQRTEDRLGGAANAARNLVALGASVTLAGFVGNDEEGAVVRRLLSAEGMGGDLVLADPGRPTTLKTRVIAHAQQMLRVDREVRGESTSAPHAEFAKAVDAALATHDAVLFSDYAKGLLSDQLLQVFETAMNDGRFSRGTRELFIDPHPSNYKRYRGCTVIKPNRAEAARATGVPIESREDAFRAAELLNERMNSDLAVVTLDKDGMVVVDRAGTVRTALDAHTLDVYDVSGAGDATAAVLLLSLAAGAAPSVAARLATVAAGIVVAEVGVVAVTKEKLLAALQGGTL